MVGNETALVPVGAAAGLPALQTNVTELTSACISSYSRDGGSFINVK